MYYGVLALHTNFKPLLENMQVTIKFACPEENTSMKEIYVNILKYKILTMEKMETEMMTSYLFNCMLNFGENDIIEDMYSRVTNDLFHDQSQMAKFVSDMSNKLTNLKSNHTIVLNCTDVQSNLLNLLSQLNVQVENTESALATAAQQYEEINIMLKRDQKWIKDKHDNTADYFRYVAILLKGSASVREYSYPATDLVNLMFLIVPKRWLLIRVGFHAPVQILNVMTII